MNTRLGWLADQTRKLSGQIGRQRYKTSNKHRRGIFGGSGLHPQFTDVCKVHVILIKKWIVCWEAGAKRTPPVSQSLCQHGRKAAHCCDPPSKAIVRTIASRSLASDLEAPQCATVLFMNTNVVPNWINLIPLRPRCGVTIFRQLKLAARPQVERRVCALLRIKKPAEAGFHSLTPAARSR